MVERDVIGVAWDENCPVFDHRLYVEDAMKPQVKVDIRCPYCRLRFGYTVTFSREPLPQVVMCFNPECQQEFSIEVRFVPIVDVKVI